MSISGAGTQADPYIVDTWADFVAAVETLDAYVKVDTSTVVTWNFAQMVEGGISTGIDWKAAEVDGNGLTIKGLFGTAERWFSATSSTEKVVKNLNFLDCVQTSATLSVFHGRSIEYRNCKFSGVVEGRSFCEGYGGGNVLFTTGSINGNDPKGCAFALKFSGEARLTYSSNVTVNHCNMNFDGTSTYTGTQTLKMYESKISGKVPWTNFTNAGGGQNVIDAEIDTIGTWSNTSGGVTLINTDKLANGLSVPSGFTGVTSTQMLDADALSFLGFCDKSDSSKGICIKHLRTCYACEA